MINFNGEIIEKESTILSCKNRAFKYGDALFETLKIQNSKINLLESHCFRLMASMRMLRMEIPMSFSLEFFQTEILKTVDENELTNARVRYTVYRNDGGLYRPATNSIGYIIEASELKINIEENYEIELFKDYFIYSGLLSTLKTTNKITNVLGGIFAYENGYDYCILLNEKKQVVETINGNIFIVKDGVIKTPPITEGCVKGVMRKALIDFFVKTSKYQFEESTISSFDIQKADEVFITNAIIGIQPVQKYRKKEFTAVISNSIRKELGSLI